MDAKGVDRPVAVVVGRPSALTEALTVELAQRGYDVHLPREVADPVDAGLYPSARWHPGGSSADVVDRAGDRWSVAVVSDPGSRAAAELVEVGAARPGASVLLVAHDAEQRRAADLLAGRLGVDTRTTVLAPRSTSLRWRREDRRRGPDRDRHVARRGLRGLAERRPRVWFVPSPG